LDDSSDFKKDIVLRVFMDTGCCGFWIIGLKGFDDFINTVKVSG